MFTSPENSVEVQWYLIFLVKNLENYLHAFKVDFEVTVLVKEWKVYSKQM